jgi:hypothetical protein
MILCKYLEGLICVLYEVSKIIEEEALQKYGKQRRKRQESSLQSNASERKPLEI